MALVAAVLATTAEGVAAFRLAAFAETTDAAGVSDLPGGETLLPTTIAFGGDLLTATPFAGGELSAAAAFVIDLAASIFALPRAGAPDFMLAVGVRPVLTLATASTS
jgi:hypothetical protein